MGCIYGGDVEYIDLLLWGGFIFEILWWYYGYLFKGMLIKRKVRYYFGCNEKKNLFISIYNNRLFLVFLKD